MTKPVKNLGVMTFAHFAGISAKLQAKAPKARASQAARTVPVEDPPEEMRGSSPIAVARRRERARCAAIIGHDAAASNMVLAANLAFKTRMTRAEAMAVLADTAAGQRSKPVQRSEAGGWDRAFAAVRSVRK
ncbi:hypothetical protein [Rhodoferax sp. GW822-FHT02A01]|uniref:hypothetical protein n=1 Tax=Rhodoferax sp. GW822-FHT02A01 TaxID=3141537 RepID=UPI00315CB624